MAKASEDLVEIADRQFWATIAEIGALVATLVFTGFAAYAAIRAVGVSRASYIADQRPWLTVQPIIESDLVFYENIAIIDVSITVRNVGKTPAEGITFDCDLIATGDRYLSDSLKDFASVTMLAQNRNIVSHQGDMLFPTERRTSTRHLTVGTFKKQHERIKVRPYAFLSLRVVVFYQFEFQERQPVTAVGYRFFRTDQKKGSDRVEFFLDEKKIAKETLGLEPSFGSLIR